MSNAERRILWLVKVSEVSESGFIKGHYIGKTDLKFDSLSFLTLYLEPFGVQNTTNVSVVLFAKNDYSTKTMQSDVC